VVGVKTPTTTTVFTQGEQEACMHQCCALRRDATVTCQQSHHVSFRLLCKVTYFTSRSVLLSADRGLLHVSVIGTVNVDVV